jgi:hypothetical protein
MIAYYLRRIFVILLIISKIKNKKNTIRSTHDFLKGFFKSNFKKASFFSTHSLRTGFIRRLRMLRNQLPPKTLGNFQNYKIRGFIKHDKNVEETKKNVTSDKRGIRSGICAIRCNPSPSQ